MLTKADVPPRLQRVLHTLRDELAKTRKGATVPIVPSVIIPLCNQVLVETADRKFESLRDAVLLIRSWIGRSDFKEVKEELRSAEDAFFALCAQLRR
jgi:hypothetical protein